jgi:pimeloyl-ACP methyl ester carboxylesterase
MTDILDRLYHPAPAAAGPRVLLVMLPGAGIEAADFAAHGMVDALHERILPVDVVATRPALDLYLDGGVTAALHRVVIEPALAQNYAKIWLLGISLGGMGALLYASAHAALLEGLILLAPFLGTQGTIAGMAAVGGLAAWSAGPATTAPEAQMLRWLQHRPRHPPVYLGYGEADRFAPGHRMLAAALPASHVVTDDGGHDWETWTTLWRQLLDAGLFGGAA